MFAKGNAPGSAATLTGAEDRQLGSLSNVLKQSVARETEKSNIDESFRRCREEVSAEDAARMYGIRIDRRGRALCPFHDDHNPSLTFHNGRFRCWSCGASGNCIDLTMELLGMDALGAVCRLDADFHLCLPLDRPLSREELRQAEDRQQLRDTRRRFDQWREATMKDLNAAFRLGHLALKECRTLTDQEAVAVRYMVEIEYWAELLDSKNMAEQMAVFRDRGEVTRICRTILQSMPTRLSAG